MGRQSRNKPVNEGRYVNTESLGSATASTTSVSIPNYGVSVIGSSANTYVLDAPESGVVKYLVRLSGGSSGALVKLSVASSLDSITAGIGATEIAWHTTDLGVVALLGVSSVKWAVLHASTGATAVNSTGIVFQTS